MVGLSVNHFRNNLKTYVDKAVYDHEPVHVTRRNGEDFVVLSAEDYAAEQETLYVLQNKSLMKQIAKALESNKKGKKITKEMQDEIDRS